MAVNLPPEWNLLAALEVAAAVLAYMWLQFGGWLRLGRLTRLLITADPELILIARDLAQEIHQAAPAVWLLRWRKANALAFIFSNAIVVTQRLREILTREEMKAVLAHEMAHLSENFATRAVRFLTPLVLLPPFTISLWWKSGNWTGFVVMYAVIFLIIIVSRRRSRRMEERADSLGHQAAADARAYPTALAKIYEANQVPAVMSGKRMTHPHLYDRMLTAGITSDYPRPKPPRRWGGPVFLFTLAVNAACLAAIWLVLF